MAVPAGPTEQRYVGNGVSTIFTVPFLVIQASDLSVILDGVELTSGYTQSGVGNPTSTVTFSVAPAVGADIFLILDVPFERLNDYQENGDFLSRTVNNDFDRIWQALKQLYTWATRSLRLGMSDVDGQGWYRAKGNGIRDLRDPVQDQDAATKKWSQDFIASILETGQGPINNAANIVLVGANGFIGAVQDIANKTDPLKGSRMLGHDGWTVGDHLAGLKYPGQFASLKAWAASGGNLGIVGGSYPITEQITFPHGTVLKTFGAVIFDASAVASAANFPDLTIVLAGVLSQVALPKLTNAVQGDLTINFASAHGLVPGDVFAIWNPTDSSFAPGHRVAYHEGEFCRVARVTSSTQVVLQAPLASGYIVASIDIYKIAPGKFNINGSLKVRGSDTLNSLRAFRGYQLIDCDVSGLNAISPMGPSAIEFRQSMNVSGDVIGEQWGLSGLGVDYGLVFSGCQDMKIEGAFAGSRHAITTGGYGQVCDIVNRNIQTKGTAKTTFQGGVPAVNTHGNTEYFSFEGMSYGGVSLGGNFSRIKGTILGGPNGVCIEFTELSGHDHDLSGCLLKTIGNPGAVSRGVLDLGGNTEPSLAGTVGGTIDCRGIRILAPNSTRAFVFRQRVSTATDIKIDLRDAAIEKLAGSAISLLMDKVSGADFAILHRAGLADNTAATQSVAGVTEIKGARTSGKVTLNTTTGVSSVTATITYPAGLFGSVAPNVSCSISQVILGTKGIVCGATSRSATGFTAAISTADGTNFPSAVAIEFSYASESSK